MTEKLKEISNKLNQLKKADIRFNTFGSVSHLYNSNKSSIDEITEFESINEIELPSELKEFLLNIGYGAGPEYGIYSLTEMLREHQEWASMLDEHSKLSNQCQLSDINAIELIHKKQNDPTSFHYKRLTNVNGILPIQTEGCTYFRFIVINGEQKGKIWAVDINEFDALPALSDVESNFLDWYESWLNNSLASLVTHEKGVLDKSNFEKKPSSWREKISHWLKSTER